MKKRRNYSISEDALLLLAEMAKKEGRNHSNMIEQLIVRAAEKEKEDAKKSV